MSKIESSTNAIDSSKEKINDETESSIKITDSNKEKISDEIKSSTNVVNDNKEKIDDEIKSSIKVTDSNKEKMEDKTKSSATITDSNKRKMDSETETSTQDITDNKRKKRDDGDLDDTASTTGSANIKKIFNDLSDYEDEIMRRILSYEIDLKESNCNELVVERLRSDNLHAHICTTEWEAIRVRGRKTYTATHSFIEIVNERGNDGTEEKLIVDLGFQSHFTFAMAARSYLELWHYLPTRFIGTEEKLRRIISIMTTAAGKRMAPWIKPDFLHSKWLSPDRKIQQ